MMSTLVYWLSIKPRLKRLQRLLPEASIHPTGSRYVCSPPVLSTDIDFLVYSEAQLGKTLVDDGYVQSEFKLYFGNGPVVHPDDFSAWRKSKENLIVTNNRRYAETFQTATYLCKLHNIKLKPSRVIVHECLRGNMKAEDNMGACVTDTGKAMTPLMQLLATLQGEHGNALHKAYRAKHGLRLD